MSLLLPKTKKHAMKKLFVILFLAAGMFSMYSCGSGSEQKEGTATDSTAAPMQQAPAETAPATADTMPADTAHH